ncbi:PREDICTED: phospholipase A2 inhibitor and Ly6/PLAUR domain-containing protein-like [Gekko japonicus]|uniref:Phospholipase A2 inhibitor and Ly6/PLAUR domain-containing protein-like n=1 Tax=Gekko japonicus TaxID=146911 RepID=A0ABM1KQT0_GEKJA|nr:PREDICTED: phospholipase A2 inhibitor and Ly6/PLAUR domain-containing protein-like [Gekko japonicus]
MGKLLVLCAAILACTSIGSALHCYKCDFTFSGMPCITKNVTCEADDVCATIKGSVGGHNVIERKDCVSRKDCNTNSTETYLKIKYTTTYYCCDGDACNSATTLSSAHLSLSMALAMLGFWFTQLL